MIASGGWWTAAQVADRLAMDGLATDGNNVRQALNALCAKAKAERRSVKAETGQHQWEYHAL